MFTPDERRSEPQDRRAAFQDALATVEWISADIQVRGHKRGCTRTGYLQGGHGLAAQELPNAGTKHLPAVTISEGITNTSEANDTKYNPSVVQ